MNMTQLQIVGARSHLIEDDIDEAAEEIEALADAEVTNWRPLFDPKETDVADDLDDLNSYRYDEDFLLKLGEDVTIIRSIINFKAGFLDANGINYDDHIDGR